MELKLFVDDLRECPAGWVPARTITEAIRILAMQAVREISLDHDIACSHNGCFKGGFESFEPVAYFLSLLRYHGDHIKVRIHTANVEAGRRMADIIGIEYNNVIFDPKDY